MSTSQSRLDPDSNRSTVLQNQIEVYSKLAALYDDIMRDVDYEDWTDYIYTIINFQHPRGNRVLELACGTGTMALELERLDNYDITATDLSPDMINIARKKGKKHKSGIRWLVRDMLRIDIDETFDIIYMVFDSLNYLHQEKQVLELINAAGRHLEPDGIFIFDFTTPSYSPKIAMLLNEERDVNKRFRYLRTNEYDSNRKIHTNHFKVEERDPSTGNIIDTFEEIHEQRIWKLGEIKDVVLRSDLRILAAYEDFDLSQATDSSDRITMVLTHG